ncbi:MAG: DUF1565 domain-containing protein, partial [Anaerolineae bacterium]
MRFHRSIWLAGLVWLLLAGLAAGFTPRAAGDVFYVATTGSDTTDSGSAGNPWQTISHALDSVPGGSLILVRPGTYTGQVDLRGSFNKGVTVRSKIPYRARLRHGDTVVTGFWG